MTIKDIKVGDLFTLDKTKEFRWSTREESVHVILNSELDNLDFEGKKCKIFGILSENRVQFDAEDYEGNYFFITTFDELNRIGAFDNLKTNNTMQYKVGDKFKIDASIQIPYALTNSNDFSPECFNSGVKSLIEKTISKITKTLVYFGGVKMKKADFEKYAIFENQTTTKGRNIIGYTLLKDAPGLKAGTKLTKSKNKGEWETEEDEDGYQNVYIDKDVIDTTWFSPIYEDVYKKGDYVWIKRTGNICIGNIIHNKETLVKISYYKEKKNWFPQGVGNPTGANDYYIGFNDNTIIFAANTLEQQNAFLLRKATEAEIEEYKENEYLIKNLGSNNISLKWDGNNVLNIIGKSERLYVNDIKIFYDNVIVNSLGQFNIEPVTTSTRNFRVGCEAENNLVSLDEIKKVIDFCTK